MACELEEGTSLAGWSKPKSMAVSPHLLLRAGELAQGTTGTVLCSNCVEGSELSVTGSSQPMIGWFASVLQGTFLIILLIIIYPWLWRGTRDRGRETKGRKNGVGRGELERKENGGEERWKGREVEEQEGEQRKRLIDHFNLISKYAQIQLHCLRFISVSAARY